MLHLTSCMDRSWARSGGFLLGENPLWQRKRNLEQKASIHVTPGIGASDPVGGRLHHVWGYLEGPILNPELLYAPAKHWSPAGQVGVAMEEAPLALVLYSFLILGSGRDQLGAVLHQPARSFQCHLIWLMSGSCDYPPGLDFFGRICCFRKKTPS